MDISHATKAIDSFHEAYETLGHDPKFSTSASLPCELKAILSMASGLEKLALAVLDLQREVEKVKKC